MNQAVCVFVRYTEAHLPKKLARPPCWEFGSSSTARQNRISKIKFISVEGTYTCDEPANYKYWLTNYFDLANVSRDQHELLL